MKTTSELSEETGLKRRAIINRAKKLKLKPRYSKGGPGIELRIFTDNEANRIINYKRKKRNSKKTK